MPPILGPVFTPAFRLRPPGLEEQEAELWARFLDRYGAYYDGFYYNVRLGEGVTPPEGLIEPYVTMARQLSQKRIDALGFKSDFWELFEVRTKASPGALGQVKMYEALWLADPPDARPLRLTLITDRSDIDVLTAARAQGIAVFVV